MRAAAFALAASIFASIPLQVSAHQKVPPGLLKLVPDLPQTAIKDPPGRIKKGRDLFFNETFRGNGRTCGTCHAATESFALSPADIAARPANDPLFVAEFNPALANLEKPALMRQLGLILENLDGFDKPGVMRGVPHTLALRTSITPEESFPLVNATGWSGDGSPGDGSLRNFVVGAILQHFPKDLLRRPGVDFRLPSKQEMDSILAFQLSLGRQADISLDGDDGIAALTFRDPDVEAGKALFITAPARNGTRSCAGCHDDAGANTAANVNRNFDTGTRRRPTIPACFDNTAPGDGGFLSANVFSQPVTCFDGRVINVTFRGDGTFNTPPLIEAADTGPFFHDNSAATLEAAIAHYTTAAFAESPAGNNNPFVLNETQINRISALLRALNSRQNAINALSALRRSDKEGQKLQADSLRESLAETRDAIQVITSSPIAIFEGSQIVPLLRQAATAQQDAINGKGNARKTNIREAIGLLTRAVSLYTT